MYILFRWLVAEVLELVMPLCCGERQSPVMAP